MTTTTTLDFQAMFGERAAEVDRALDHKSGTFSNFLCGFFENVAAAEKTGLCDASGLQLIMGKFRRAYPDGLPYLPGGEWPNKYVFPAAELLVSLAVHGDFEGSYAALASALAVFVNVDPSWKDAEKYQLLLSCAAAYMKANEANLRPRLEMLFFPHLQANRPEHISESTPRLAGKPGLAQLCSLANDMQQITSRPVDAWARTVFDQASGITLMGSRLLVLRDELHAESRFCVQQWLAYLQSSALSSTYAEHGLALQLNIEQGLASLVPIPGYPNAEYEAFPIMVMPFHLANKTPWLASMQSCKGLLPLGSNIVG